MIFRLRGTGAVSISTPAGFADEAYRTGVRQEAI
jgi:hypothetical protein